MNRRDFLKAVTTSVAGMSVVDAFAQEVPQAGQVYRTPTILWMRRGGDEMRFDYGNEEGYRAASWLLRDVQANQNGYPDWRLLQTLSWMQTFLAMYGHHVCFDALSGLRTQATNNRESGARNSFHLPDQRGVFRAVDFRTKSVPSAYMGKLAALLQQGGVGFYTRNFTHIDTGQLIGSSGSQRIWHHR